MKLRPRIKVPTNNGSAAAPPVPVVHPHTTHLQSKPISLSDTSSSVEDDSDLQEMTEPLSPTKDKPRPKTTVQSAPLTENNLEILQEEITSSEEIQSARNSSPPTPSIRLVQARDFLLAENQDTCPELPTRIQQIANYLHDLPRESKEAHASVYREIKNLLRSHRFSINEREKSHRARRTSRLPSELRTPPPLLLPARADDEHHEDERADPFEWTNKLDDLIDAVRLDPQNLNREYMIARVRELARPLNGGRLPDAEMAGRLVNERVVGEHAGMGGKGKEKERNWAGFEGEELPWEKKRDNDKSLTTIHQGLGARDTKGMKSAHEHGAMKTKSQPKNLQLGLGSYMPREVKDFNWERDCDGGLLLRGKSGGDFGSEDGDGDEDGGSEDGDGDGEGAQILLAETPFLQALMGGQVGRDLEGGSKNKTATTTASAAAAVDTAIPLEPKTMSIPIPYRFPLSEPSVERMEEAMEIAKTLDLELDTRMLKRGKRKRKRKREEDGDGDGGSEDKKEDGGSEDGSLPSRDSLFDSPSGLDVEMSGALQEDDDLHLYSDD